MTPDPSPPPPQQLPIRIESPKGGVGLVVVFAGNIRGCMTHWYQGRSHYCAGEGRCDPAKHRLRADWKGYPPVYIWHEGPNCYTPAVLEVTENLDLQLQGRQLVGETWLVSRDTSSKRNGPVSGALLGQADDPQLRVYFDPLPCLYWVWRVKGIELGVPNPLAARPTGQVITATRPQLIDPRPAKPAKPVSPKQLEALKAKVRERFAGQAIPESFVDQLAKAEATTNGDH